MSEQPSSAADPVLLVSRSAGALTLTLNRPAAFNAFDQALRDALLNAVTAAADDPAVRVLVITGSGRAFGAGQDLKEHQARLAADDPRATMLVRDFYNPLVLAITGMRQPVLAAVNGVAAGAGAGLAFACDLRIAAASARFAMAFAAAGLSADTGVTYTLPRLVGRGRALRMLLTGETVDAARAEAIGLVDWVVPDDELVGRAATIAGQLARSAAGALGWIKASVRQAETSDLTGALAFEKRAQLACFRSADHAEALAAFTAKRPPVFD